MARSNIIPFAEAAARIRASRKEQVDQERLARYLFIGSQIKVFNEIKGRYTSRSYFAISG